MITNEFPEVWLTTLDALKLHRGLNANNIPQESRYQPEEMDALLTQCIVNASASIVEELGRLPLPHRKTEQYPGIYYPRLYIPDDVLEVMTVTAANGDVVDSADYQLAPLNRYPKYNLDLIASSSCTHLYWWDTELPGISQVVTLEGIFGYVPHWPHAWQVTGEVLPGTAPAEGLSATATSLAVSASETFPIGAYGRLEAEYIQFTGRTDTDVEFERGVLGTTAVAHVAGTPIELYRHYTTFQSQCTEWAAFIFKSLESLGEEVQVFDGTVQYVKGLSPLVKRALRKHKRM